MSKWKRKEQTRLGRICCFLKHKTSFMELLISCIFSSSFFMYLFVLCLNDDETRYSFCYVFIDEPSSYWVDEFASPNPANLSSCFHINVLNIIDRPN